MKTLLALIAAFAATTLVVNSAAAEVPAQLLRPDGKPADQTKKVKVFILMGQSNMVGMGDILPADKQGTLTALTTTEKKYPYLVDDAGQWTVRKDVHVEGVFCEDFNVPIPVWLLLHCSWATAR